MLLKRTVKEDVIKFFFFMLAAVSIFIVFFVIYFLFSESLPAFQEYGFSIFESEWSVPREVYKIGAALFGTAIVTIGAMIIAIPLGLLVGIFLSEIAPFHIRTILKPVIELLAGIPSIVYGFLGATLLVQYLQPSFDLLKGISLFAGSLVLGIMALPIIISISDDALKAVPRDLKEASLALGATKWETIKKITFPSAISGVSAAIIMGMGRAVGETMAVSLVVGNIMQIPVPPFDIFESGSTLTSIIALEMGEATGIQTYSLFACGVILFIIVGTMSVTSNLLKERVEKKYKGG
ncbi:MAG: phosphate ABC transporter permease subunit PstC [Candidatus Thermoplasmatota archaeon]|nr:phosphate ABC transporter permease subunit PstC [Candidatus Thermoplasmatota archaeon]MBS3801890.1 phosphate ABC transporter permease subunit PstC [Candidatus Thermoplasmatota archaeon]